MSGPSGAGMRIDKWLWAARFFKTRALAAQAIAAHRVLVAGQPVKPARELRVGERLQVQQVPGSGQVPREVVVLGLSAQRGPAPVAQALYAETEDSLRRRAAAAEQRRLSPEPAASIVGGRPTKRDRRALEQGRMDQNGRPGWDARWSASID